MLNIDSQFQALSGALSRGFLLDVWRFGSLVCGRGGAVLITAMPRRLSMCKPERERDRERERERDRERERESERDIQKGLLLNSET